jgi:hypothetical protein
MGLNTLQLVEIIVVLLIIGFTLFIMHSLNLFKKD